MNPNMNPCAWVFKRDGCRTFDPLITNQRLTFLPPRFGVPPVFP